jgi:ERCC4-type nuclease
MEEKITFIGVDRRLRACPVVDALAEDPSLGLVFLHLEAGDYLLSHRTAVKMLPLNEFLDSLKNGHMADWADEISGHYSDPILVVEGNDSDPDEMVDRDSFQEAISFLLTQRKIPVLFSERPEATAEIIVALAQYLGEVAVPQLDILKKGTEGGTDSSFPRLGVQLAERLKERLGNAGFEESTKVPGVGYMNARELFGLLEPAE